MLGHAARRGVSDRQLLQTLRDNIGHSAIDDIIEDYLAGKIKVKDGMSQKDVVCFVSQNKFKEKIERKREIKMMMMTRGW